MGRAHTFRDGQTFQLEHPELRDVAWALRALEQAEAFLGQGRPPLHTFMEGLNREKYAGEQMAIEDVDTARLLIANAQMSLMEGYERALCGWDAWGAYRCQPEEALDGLAPGRGFEAVHRIWKRNWKRLRDEAWIWKRGWKGKSSGEILDELTRDND